MLGVQGAAGLILSGLMLVVYFGRHLKTGWIKTILIIICANSLSYMLNPSIVYSLVSLTLVIFVLYNDKQGVSSLLNCSVLVAAFASGNWMEPGIVEMIAAIALVGNFIINGHSNVAKILPLSSALIVSVSISSVYQNQSSEILLISCSLFAMFYYGLFWYQDKHCTSPYASASLFVLTIFYKLFVDQHLLGLTARHALVANNLIVGSLAATSVFSIYQGLKKNQNWSALFRLFLLNIGFTTAGLYIDSSFSLGEIAALLIIFVGSAMLLKIERVPKKLDQYIAGIIGIIMVSLQFLYIKTHLIGVPALYILIINISAQLYFLIKIIGHCEKIGQVTVKTGERLPQFLYIGGVFGAIASLWYILNYVRQIQG